MRLPRGIVTKGNSYYARVYVKGREHSFALGPDLDSATARFYQIKAAVHAGKDPDPEPEPKPAAANLTVSEAVSRWLSDRVDLELEARNAACIRARAEQVVVPFLGPDRPLLSVRRADCFAYLAHVRRTRPWLKPASVEHYLRTLREFLNWCVDVEELAESPFPPKRIVPKAEKSKPKRLSDEAVQVLVALPNPWGFNLRLAITTGLRWRELVRLERTDLTPDGQLLVRRAKDKEYRTVPIPRALLTEILGRKGHLFITREGEPYSEASAAGFAGTIRRLAKKHSEGLETAVREELARFHVHQTRHTMATRYLEAGGLQPMLQQILGHSTGRMTERYGRPGEKAIRADAAAVFASWEGSNREGNREFLGNGAVEASGGTC